MDFLERDVVNLCLSRTELLENCDRSCFGQFAEGCFADDLANFDETSAVLMLVGFGMMIMLTMVSVLVGMRMLMRRWWPGRSRRVFIPRDRRVQRERRAEAKDQRPQFFRGFHKTLTTEETEFHGENHRENHTGLFPSVALLCVSLFSLCSRFREEVVANSTKERPI